MSTEESKKSKTEAQLRKEAAKAEKIAKFQEKMKKKEEKKVLEDAKPKTEKKTRVIITYESNTKLGEKKGTIIIIQYIYPIYF